MKQVLAKQGSIIVADVPAPTTEPGMIVIRTAASLISTGTEMTAVKGAGGGSGSLPMKILRQPSLMMLGLKAVKQYGLKKTYQAATGSQELGSPLGYSAAGTVTSVGIGVEDIAVGDRVAAAGASLANHAEYINVPRNLVVKIPEGVEWAAAASVTLGAIALQGVRQADPRLGDIVVVSGLGLLGQITVQLLRAQGCQVIGIDPDATRRDQALAAGAVRCYGPQADDMKPGILSLTNGFGADQTIITAATPSDGPINQAMDITRAKGTVVIVGAVGLNVARSPFYEKEIDLKISRSYGPGRYDETYEQYGLDYPYSYVRWTENRNMQAYLQLIAEGKLKLASILQAEYPIDRAPEAYAALQQPDKKPLAVTLTYPTVTSDSPATTLRRTTGVAHSGPVRVGLIGAGNFALGMHLPNFEKLKNLYTVRGVADRNSVTATKAAAMGKAEIATTDYHELLSDKDIDLIMVTTRHHLHASLAIEALRAGKSVFVEKPMAMNSAELTELVKTIKTSKQIYTVGFNRRFSPAAIAIREHVQHRVNPLVMYYRMNAGYLPPSHWTHGAEGGGRIIGEGCHIFDLFAAWTGAKPVDVKVSAISPHNANYKADDNVSVTVKYSDGSIGTLIYTALGNTTFPKEYAEIYVDGQTIIMEDYKKLQTFGTGPSGQWPAGDKGHLHEIEVLGEALRTAGSPWPIPLEDMVATTELTFQVQDQISSQTPA